MIHFKRVRLYSLLGIAFIFTFLFCLNLNKGPKISNEEKINHIRSIFNYSADLNNNKIKNPIIANYNNKYNDKYIFPIESMRINKLFKKLHAKEKEYSSILDSLELPSFNKIINKELIKNFDYAHYLQESNNEVIATEEFVTYLSDLSSKHSFNPRSNISRQKIINV